MLRYELNKQTHKRFLAHQFAL